MDTERYIPCRCGVNVRTCIKGCVLFECCGGYVNEGHMSDCESPQSYTVSGRDRRRVSSDPRDGGESINEKLGAYVRTNKGGYTRDNPPGYVALYVGKDDYADMHSVNPGEYHLKFIVCTDSQEERYVQAGDIANALFELGYYVYLYETDDADGLPDTLTTEMQLDIQSYPWAINGYDSDGMTVEMHKHARAVWEATH